MSLSEAALARLSELGATFVDIEVPHMQALSVAHGMIISAEFR
jgi:hypothetical protein